MTRYEFKKAPYQIEGGKWVASIGIKEFTEEGNIVNYKFTNETDEYDTEEKALKGCEKLILIKKGQLGI